MDHLPIDFNNLDEISNFFDLSFDLTDVSLFALDHQINELFSSQNQQNQSSVSSSSDNTRPYQCEILGCRKNFLNKNGLSYHKSHIHFPHLLNGNDKDINMSKLKEKDMMSSSLPQAYNSLKRKSILGSRIDGHCNRDSSLSASASGTTTIKSQH
jgi:hypothetical protein